MASARSVDLNCLAVFGDRRFELTLAIQGIAEVVMGESVVGLNLDGLAVFGDRLMNFVRSLRALPKLLWAAAEPGWRAIAAV